MLLYIDIQVSIALSVQVDNIPKICDSIILYEAMHKRKVFLDAFAEGLEVFKIRSAINLYPEMFKTLFVASDTCTPDDVIATLNMPYTMSPEHQRIAGYLKDCIKQLDETGNPTVIIIITIIVIHYSFLSQVHGSVYDGFTVAMTGF